MRELEAQPPQASAASCRNAFTRTRIPASFPRSPVGPGGRARRWALAFVFLWFLLGGLAHFVATDLEVRIVPPWVPWPRAVVLATGVLELLGAAGLLWRPARRAAGLVLFALTVAVTPANVYMLQASELFPGVPVWALVLRLPLQMVLLGLIAWSTGAFSMFRRQGNG